MAHTMEQIIHWKLDGYLCHIVFVKAVR